MQSPPLLFSARSSTHWCTCVWFQLFSGIALTCTSGLSFSMNGFVAATASNIFTIGCNVLVAKFDSLGDMGDGSMVRKVNQFGVSTCVGSVLSFPLALAHSSGLRSFSTAWSDALASGASSHELVFLWTSSCALFFLQMITSFVVLSYTEPLSHSVLNSVKRVLVIVLSFLFFRDPVSWKEWVGTTMAVGGVLAYSFAKHHFTDGFTFKVVPQDAPRTPSITSL